MFPQPSNSNQHLVYTKPLSVQGSSALVPVENGEFTKADMIIRESQKLQDDLRSLGMKIKQHEDKLSLLTTEKSQLDDAILHLQVAIGKSKSSSTAKIGNADDLHITTEEEVNKQILQHEKSAAGILCQVKTHHGAQASLLGLTQDVVGVVAMLGKVEDDNLSRLFSEYLGVETVLAIVCRTYEGVKALELYDKEGPYAGKYVVDDSQRKLDILNPRLPNGECPAGFIGFAVNMINIDNRYLFCLTPSGYGLRETLFYNLFSRLQVYKTRAEMIQALPCISDGALSLDGGMIRSCGVFSLGNREAVDVRFPRPERPLGLDQHIEMERQMMNTQWKKDKVFDDLKREKTMLDMAKFSFNKKKSDFLKYLATSSSYATQVQTAPYLHQ